MRSARLGHTAVKNEVHFAPLCLKPMVEGLLRNNVSLNSGTPRTPGHLLGAAWFCRNGSQSRHLRVAEQIQRRGVAPEPRSGRQASWVSAGCLLVAVFFFLLLLLCVLDPCFLLLVVFWIIGLVVLLLLLFCVGLVFSFCVCYLFIYFYFFGGGAKFQYQMCECVLLGGVASREETISGSLCGQNGEPEANQVYPTNHIPKEHILQTHAGKMQEDVNFESMRKAALIRGG